MVLRRFADFVLQSRLNAILVVVLCSFIPFVGIVSILIAALVTLRKGIFEGAVITLAASVPVVVGYLMFPATEQIDLAFSAFAIVLLSNILTWFFACVLYRNGQWSLTLEFAILIGIAIVGAVHFFYPTIQGFWGDELTKYFGKTAEMLSPKLSDAELDAIQTIKQYATGLVVASILFNALVQLLVARWWQSIAYQPQGLRKELYQIRLGYAAGAILIAALILAYSGNGTALDCLPVIFLSFVTAGLSVVHFYLAPMLRGWLWLTMIYVGLVWLVPWSVFVISFLAFIDIGLDIRKRFN